MNHSAFQLSPDFISSLLIKIDKLRKQYTNEISLMSLFKNSPLVLQEQLANIIDTAFWASQKAEEGKQIKISLVLSEMDNSSNNFGFEHSIPLNAKNLVKLGSALDSSFSDICIWPDEHGRLRIWGLKMRSIIQLTTDLWIQVLGPGNILIICYGRSIAAVIGNQAVFIDPSSLFKAIIPKICSNCQTPDAYDPIHLTRFNTLLFIAQAMRSHQRGGTLLVVPEGNSWKQSVRQPTTFTGGSSFLDPDFIPISTLSPKITQQDLSNILEDMRSPKNKEGEKRRLQALDQCGRIGRLTAVDGALVMTFDRYVHCFGAKIKTIHSQPDSADVLVLKPVEGDIGERAMISDIGGMRHFSAAQFAYDQPDSVAIVASQDGNVTFFSKDNSTGELLLVQQAELVLMYEGISGAIWNFFQFGLGGNLFERS